MTLGTHVAFASVLYLGGATLFGYKPDLIGWLLAAAASLLPDADLPPAKIGRLFWFLSGPLGGKGEMILLAVLIGLTVALYPLSHVGFRDALQVVLKNFDIACEQYPRQAGFAPISKDNALARRTE